VLEQGQVLGNSRLRQPKALPDFFDVAALRHQPGNDLEPDRMAEDLENFRLTIETLGFDKLGVGHG